MKRYDHKLVPLYVDDRIVGAEPRGDDSRQEKAKFHFWREPEARERATRRQCGEERARSRLDRTGEHDPQRTIDLETKTPGGRRQGIRTFGESCALHRRKG